MEPANDEWLAQRAPPTARALDLRRPASRSDASGRVHSVVARAELTRA